VQILLGTATGLARFDGGRDLDWLTKGDVRTISGRWAIVDHSVVAVDEPDVAIPVEPQPLSLAATAAGVLIGTAEARLFVLPPGERAVQPVRSFDEIPTRDQWYTPWGGPPDTRSISEWDEHVYVNVHVGGIVRTADAGASWTPTIDIDADVHQVTTVEGPLVLAACADGLAASADHGDSWEARTDGLGHRYARAATVVGDTVLLSTSRGPRGGEAAVYRAPLGGGAFQRCTQGLPASFDGNIDSHCLDGPPDGSFVAFGTEDGRVFTSEDAGSSWELAADSLPRVRRVLVLPA
jgi:hypothetical protein